MPLFVLRIAEGGAADLDGRLRVSKEAHGYIGERKKCKCFEGYFPALL